MKKVIIISILFLSTHLLMAQEEDSNLSRYIGGAFGISTGYGLSYRYWPGDLGWQVVFSPYSDGEDYTINLGTGIFKSLYETNYTRLFVYGAMNGTYNYTAEQTWEYLNDSNQTVVETDEAQHNLGGTLGIGPGMEIYLFKNIVLNFMFGYRISIGSSQIIGAGLGFTFETALYYRF